MWFFWCILGPWATANYCSAGIKSLRGTACYLHIDGDQDPDPADQFDGDPDPTCQCDADPQHCILAFPLHIDADPDPDHFDVDPDPTLQCNAYPCNTAFLSIF